MPNAVHVDTADYPLQPMSCLRCGQEAMLRFAGPCPACAAELHEKYKGEARDVADAAFVPKMNVTPNAVALKDD
jgi:hypothetical protein